ncbi:LysR substrate-binding domain-containing protein [Citrobacter braakii]|uniref:LysR family transcriptional regulator n=1 Tax=Citrobacter braakii TaxID=57706 RepID=UPI002AD035FF|nr:LysR substrate-binding domain-containing protein [Citrobacter braakii]EKU4735730.1 LysR family transcriptional regulator [Kluyvera ascorbata]EMB3266383.1 LysR family transcriptional regulator [Klebsiella michiganensis]MEC3928341.1 LysR substrate-binding domain-containing protein [Citrobacter braakii]
MDNKLLKSFIILAQSQSYRQAAEKLFITQPALTKQINLLEHELDLSLFERDNHGAKLSEEGEMLYQNALVLDEQINHFLCIAKKIRTGKTGHLNIGYTSSFLNIVPEIVNSFNTQYPNINIKLIEMSSIQQEQELLKGRIDLGFMRKSEENNLSFIPLGKDFLCVVTHPDIKNKKQTIDDLIDAHNLILLSEISNPELHHIVSDYLKTRNFDKKPAQYLTNVYSVLALVGSRMGVTILPHSIISFLKSNFSYQALTGYQSEWPLGLAWNKQLDIFLRTEFINSVIENNPTEIDDSQILKR